MPLKRLYKQETGGATASGIYLGVQETDAPMWVDGENVIFRDGGVQKIKGWSDSSIDLSGFSETGVIRGMGATQDESATQRLYFGTQDALYVWNGSTTTQLATGFNGNEDESSANDATHWSFARFGNWTIATNGIDTPQIHKPDSSPSSSADLGGLSGPSPSITKALLVATLQNHVLLLSTTNGNVVHWSDADDPETWAPTSTNAAGDLYIRDMNGGIRAVVKFEDRLAVLGRNELVFINYLGDPLYFGYERALSGIGAVGPRACVEANRNLFGLSNGGFWQSDGVDFQFIDNPAIRAWFRENLQESQVTKVVCTHEAINQNVVWFFPESGNSEPTAGLVYHYPTGAWSYWSFGRSAAVESSLDVYEKPFYATGTSIFQHETGESADGSNLTARIRTKPLDMDSAIHDKYVDTLVTGLRDLSGTLQARIGTRDRLTERIIWSDFVTVLADYEGDHIRKAGRFHNIEWQSEGTNDSWKLSGFELIGQIRGSRRGTLGASPSLVAGQSIEFEDGTNMTFEDGTDAEFEGTAA